MLSVYESYHKKKVLVTGGAGFIGSNLVIRLVQLGADVTVLDSMDVDCGGNSFNLKDVAENIRFVREDMCHESVARSVVDRQQFIFNLAGNVSHKQSMVVPMQDMELNVRAHIQLLEACRHVNPDAVIVHSSTRQIYGSPQYLPVDEKHPIHPLDVNGINKYAGEQYHTLYARVYGLKTIALRLTNTYGPRQLIQHSQQGFIGWFVNRVVTGNPIELFGTGDQLRDFNYIDDVVDAFLLAGRTERCFGKVFNLSGERASLKNVAQSLIQIAGSGELKIVPFPMEQKKIEIGDYYGSSNLYQQATGWQASIGLIEGLSAMYSYYLQHREAYLSNGTR